MPDIYRPSKHKIIIKNCKKTYKRNKIIFYSLFRWFSWVAIEIFCRKIGAPPPVRRRPAEPVGKRRVLESRSDVMDLRVRKWTRGSGWAGSKTCDALWSLPPDPTTSARLTLRFRPRPRLFSRLRLRLTNSLRSSLRSRPGLGPRFCPCSSFISF